MCLNFHLPSLFSSHPSSSLIPSGLSNIIGIIVYISSNAGDPSDKKDEDKKNQYNYGWSFYFGALSFIVAESVGVLAVNIYIEKNKETRFRARRDFIKTTSSSSPYSRIPSYRYRRRRSRSSSRSSDPSREPSPVGLKMGGGSGAGGGGGGLGMGLPMGDISLYALSRDPLKGGSGTGGPYSPERDFLQVHNCFQKDLKDGANRRTTPVWGQEFTAVWNNELRGKHCTVDEKGQIVPGAVQATALLKGQSSELFSSCRSVTENVPVCQ